jgi:hypothetical protein
MRLTLQVGIPWRPTPSRLPAFQQTKAFWESLGFQVVTHDSGHAVFNVAATRNQLVKIIRDRQELVIICDADTTCERGALEEAAEAARQDHLIHLPYHLYRTSAGQYLPGAASGILLFREHAWLRTNGQDEVFEGWGYEDTAFRLAQFTLNGPFVHHKGTATAAVHVEASLEQLPRNQSRYRQYVQAYGNVAAMQLLVGPLAEELRTPTWPSP